MRFSTLLVFMFILIPYTAISQTVGDSSVQLGETLISDPVWYAAAVGLVSLVSTVITAGISSKGWNPVFQVVIDILNVLAGNVMKNKNADS